MIDAEKLVLQRELGLDIFSIPWTRPISASYLPEFVTGNLRRLGK